MKKTNRKECKPTEHSFVYQLMSQDKNENLDMTLADMVNKRILYCSGCGKVKTLRL